MGKTENNYAEGVTFAGNEQTGANPPAGGGCGGTAAKEGKGRAGGSDGRR